MLVPERGRPLTWRVGHTARGGDVLVVSGPNTGWRFQVVTAYGTQREPLEKKVGTLRENAIALRQKWLEADLRRLRRGFRDTENLSADEQREAVRGQIEVLKRELRTLAALPADATDADVRRAMGLEAD